jgi:hypothetical protein
MRATATLMLALLMLPGPLVAGERDEQVLSWDDGGLVNCGMCPAPMDLREMAVRFQAPEGFHWLREIRFYACNDGVVDPDDPQAPTTGPCTLAVWRPVEAGGEGPPASRPEHAFALSGGYPEEHLIALVLPEAIDLSEEAVFPSGEFFVGMVWVNGMNPVLAVDWDPIVMGNTWRKIPSEWECCTEYSVLIRAVVADSSGSPVQLESWGRVKARYQD